jgi:hypothetical protein
MHTFNSHVYMKYCVICKEFYTGMTWLYENETYFKISKVYSGSCLEILHQDLIQFNE